MMTSVEVVDVVEELSDENKRLLKELLFANKCLKALIEFKTFSELLFNTFKYNFSFDDLLKYEGLGRKVEDLLARPAEDRHEDEAKKEQTFECNICKHRYRFVQSVRRHLLNLHNKSTDLKNFFTVREGPSDECQEVVECDVCHTRFGSKAGLNKHLHSHKAGNGKRKIRVNTTPRLDEPRVVYECRVCSARYNFIQGVKKHLRKRHSMTEHLNDYVIKRVKDSLSEPNEQTVPEASEVVTFDEMIGQIKESVEQIDESVETENSYQISGEVEVITEDYMTVDHNYYIDDQKNSTEKSSGLNIEVNISALKQKISERIEENKSGNEDTDNQRDDRPLKARNSQSLAEEETNASIESNGIEEFVSHKEETDPLTSKRPSDVTTDEWSPKKTTENNDTQQKSDRDLKCGLCLRVFTFKSNLIRHLRTIHNRSDRQIEEVQNIFDGKSTTHCNIDRSQLSKNERLTVEQSGDTSPEEQTEGLIKDMSTDEPTIESEQTNQSSDSPEMKNNQSFRCDICSRSFVSDLDLTRHSRIIHNICDQLIDEQTGETMPYKCLICGKQFLANSGLSVHMRFHSMVDKKTIEKTKNRPFECGLCHIGFNRSQDVRKHLRNMHRKFEKLGDLVITRSALKEGGQLDEDRVTSTSNSHSRADPSTSKPYKCTLCGYRAELSCYIRTHLKNYHKLVKDLNRIITKDSDYDEDQEEVRLKDMRLPFECIICEHRSIEASDIRKHLKNRHKQTKGLDKLIRGFRQSKLDQIGSNECEQEEADHNYLKEEESDNDNEEEEALPANRTTDKVLKKPFVCTVCGYRAEMACYVRRHLRKGHKKFDHSNEELNSFVENKRKSEQSIEVLVREEKEYERKMSEELLNKKRYECDVCGLKFSFMTAVSRHKRRLHSICNNTVRKQKKHQRPDNNVKPKPRLQVKCRFDGCQRVFSSRLTAGAHFRTAHKNTGKDTNREYVCDYPGCDYRSSHKQRLLTHKTVHSTDHPFKCQYADCKSAFKSKGNLQLHVKEFHVGNTHLCPYDGCGQTFRYRHHRVKHIEQVHTCSDQLYLCPWPGCDYSNRREKYVRRHELSHRHRPEDYRFVCDWPECNKRYKRLRNLKWHIMTHKNDKRFGCNWPGCEYRAIRAENVKSHMKTHQK